jgi:t-SNARE complex subunit (syntaxin)
MAETTKLSVGQALEKLRGTDAPKTKMTRLDEKIETLDKETQQLRATRRHLERDQRAGSTGRDVQEANARRVTKLKILGIIIGIVIVIPILAWKWGLL